MVVDWHDSSVVYRVTNCGLIHSQLLFEECKLVDFNWVNSSKHVPVHKLLARWHGQGSLVNPSVLEIGEVHDFTVGNDVDNGHTLSIELQVVEESLQSVVLGLSNGLIIILNREKEGDGGILQVGGIVPLGGVMVNLHLEIVVPTVNGVLGWGVEVEHEGVKSCRVGIHFGDGKL